MEDFSLKKKELNQILRHVLEDASCECCGIVTGPDSESGDYTVHRCANIQNRLHEEDPEGNPRDSRTAYYIDPDDLLKIVNGGKGESRFIRAVYHSHIENKAYFSEEDKRRALVWGEPAYPDVRYVVVSVIKGRVGEVKVFYWDRKKRDYQEEPLDT